jgi:hypothetical protein
MTPQTLVTLRRDPVYKNFCAARDDEDNTILRSGDNTVIFILDTVDASDRSFFINKKSTIHGFYAYEDYRYVKYQNLMKPQGLQQYSKTSEPMQARTSTGDLFNLKILSVIHAKRVSSKVFYVTADVSS